MNLLNANNNNSENVPELVATKSAFPSSVSVSVSSPSPDCNDPWLGYEKYLSEAIILLNQLTSKRDCLRVSANKTGVRADESIKIYPLAGAFLGSCLGGPVGFLAGVKIGGLAAVGGGILGKLLCFYTLYLLEGPLFLQPNN